MKILIVDDEPLVRIGMRSIIRWEEYGYSIAGEASNGQDALVLIDQLKPDIVLADMMMPEMNGLTMIKEAKSRGYQGKFIVLSCVSEFEYLSQAIKLGVSRYVLKSTVKPEEILEAVNEVSQEINKNRVFGSDFGDASDLLNDHYAFREFLNLSLKGVIEEKEIILEKMKAFGLSECWPDYMVLSEIKETGSKNQSDLYRAAGIAKSLLNEKKNSLVFVSYEDYLVIFIYGNEKVLKETIFRMTESVEQYFGIKLSSAWQGGLTDSSLKDIYESLKQKLHAEFYEVEDKEADKNKLAGIPSTEFCSYEKLSNAISWMKGMLRERKNLSEGEVKKFYINTVEYAMNLLDLKLGQVLPECEGKRDQTIEDMLQQAETFDSLHEDTLTILYNCYQAAEKNGFNRYDDQLTDTMVGFICKKYKNKLSTRDVAEYINFSIDYTCKYFKKQTGTNLVDYILKYKILKAREELIQGKSVAEIAAEYSFSSDGHFIKTFKKYEGITPYAYVKKNKEL